MMSRVYDLLNHLPYEMKFLDLTAYPYKTITALELKEQYKNDMDNCYCTCISNSNKLMIAQRGKLVLYIQE
jgi:hypothetical protein